MVTPLDIQPKQAVWLAALLLVGVYLAMNLGLANVVGGYFGTYIVIPLLWLVIGLAVIFLPKYRTPASSRDRASIVQLAVIIGLFQVALYVIGGLFSGFGESPYSFTPRGILTNLFYAGAILFGMEFSRAWVVNYFGRKHPFLAIAAVTLVFTLLSIPLGQITGLQLEVSSISYVNSALLPSLAENLLATSLAMLGGAVPALIFRGILQVFWWFSPVLPDLPWVFKGLIGTVLPIVGVVYLNNLFNLQGRKKKSRQSSGTLTGWVATSIVSVAVIWFAVGLFPVQPALIASGSMQPEMQVGDVVIVVKSNPDVIQAGDVIQFREADGTTTLHRVVEVEGTGAGKLFITKGDANDSPDAEPVLPDNIVGEAVFTVPKVGWVAIWIKELLAD